MSPRRSSRARTTQPTLSATKHTNSSSSSMSSSRAERNAHLNQNRASQRSSVTARSQSSEDGDSTPKPQARRTRSSQGDVKDQVSHAVEDDDEGEEEEVTRCICGNQDYAGLPVTPNEVTKESSKGDSNPAALAEDTTGWFIQCDGCKVWQHGGCVGIMDETTSPEEYFCDLCRKDLHKIITTANGRKYSYYLPAQETGSPQSSPAPTHKDHSKTPRNRRASQVNADNLLKGGRRSTMNSRDAAYEEEQLRRAIEESKREGGGSIMATGPRNGKRSRSESEERKEDTKRQRTTSGSVSSNSQSKSHRPAADSDVEAHKPERFKNIRGAAARNHRNKEVRDREAQRERENADAGVRKRRAGKERDDESDQSPEPLSRTISARGTKALSTPFIAPPPPDHLSTKISHKKSGRPPARRGRVGKNQYTKDRDLPIHSDIPTTNISPAPSNSSQNADGSTPHINGISNGYADSNGLSKPSKTHKMNPNRTTMNDMKRRVAGILEFISHMQVEMAGTEPPSTTKSSTSTNTPPDSNGNTNGRDNIAGKAVNAAFENIDAVDEQAFGALSSLEMMELLTRRLMKWQGRYGKYGEK